MRLGPTRFSQCDRHVSVQHSFSSSSLHYFRLFWNSGAPIHLGRRKSTASLSNPATISEQQKGRENETLGSTFSLSSYGGKISCAVAQKGYPLRWKMVGGRPVTGKLDAWFKSLIVADGRGKMETGTTLSGWKDLPMELLLRILVLGDDRMVIVASGVCTGWREAICLGRSQLCLSWCKEHMNDLVLSLAPKFTNLQVLSLRQNKPQLEDNAVQSIANYCHDIFDLDLSKSKRLSDASLYALAHGCPRLTKLNISGCTAFSDSALSYLTSFCTKLKYLNLCGCVRAASDRALQAIAYNCRQLQSLTLGWCEGATDKGVISLAVGCPDLRAVDLCGCVLITDESVIALANGCPRLRSLGLYYCQNITDRAMYSLANSRMKSKHCSWPSQHDNTDDDGLINLNISQCTALTPLAVQAVCDSFPALHTCAGRHSLIISGCLSLTAVHCACAFQAHRQVRAGLSH